MILHKVIRHITEIHMSAHIYIYMSFIYSSTCLLCRHTHTHPCVPAPTGSMGEARDENGGVMCDVPVGAIRPLESLGVGFRGLGHCARMT